MEYLDNIDTSILLAAMGVFFVGLGAFFSGLAKLFSSLPPTPPAKHGLFGKKK